MAAPSLKVSAFRILVRSSLSSFDEPHEMLKSSLFQRFNPTDERIECQAVKAVDLSPRHHLSEASAHRFLHNIHGIGGFLTPSACAL